MKTKHDGDCTIYAVLENIGMPEAGICTCGYGHQYRYENDGDDKEMYSKQLLKKIEIFNEVQKQTQRPHPSLDTSHSKAQDARNG